jgi:colanic acid/amylovoran biosynthesis protein
MGDVAMLQVATSRLRALWPTAAIAIPTYDEARLRRYCGDITPLYYGDWFDDRYFLGRIHKLLPGGISRGLIQLKVRLRRPRPDLEERAIRLKMRLRGIDRSDFDASARAAKDADAVVVSGAGGLMDRFPQFTIGVLRTLEIAILRGKPTAMFSQGFGSLDNPDLRARAKAVLPFVNLIALREKRVGPSLLGDLGVDSSRIAITGDDAIDIAYHRKPDCRGGGVGINIRIGRAAALSEDIVDDLRPTIQSFAQQHHCPLVTVPIALQQRLDAGNIDNLVSGYSSIEPLPEMADTPAEVVKHVSRCRIVVTGAYHAAVFALAQGLPVVALAKSTYFLDKFNGLAGMFGSGCQVVVLTSDALKERLSRAMNIAWESAERQRAPLLAAAKTQIDSSVAAYQRFGQLLVRQGGSH